MSIKPVNNPQGFTLIEILITVLILSIGLLGLAGLQVSSMKSNHSSYLRSQATILAYDIIDRMRANPNAAEIKSAKSDYVANSTTTPAVTADCKTTTGCSAKDMAGTDINQWRADIANLLPGGIGAICLDTSPDDGDDLSKTDCSNSGNVYAIKIWWNDDRSATLKRFVTSYAP